MIVLALSLLAATAQTPAAKPAEGDGDSKMMCRRIVRTGSRLATKRVCMSAFDWHMVEERAQREVGDIKTRSQPESTPVF